VLLSEVPRLGLSQQLSDSLSEDSAQRIVDAAAAPDQWKREFLQTVTREWIGTFGKVQLIPLGHFARLVLADAPEVIRANLLALLWLRPDPAFVSFADFVVLMLRFGPIEKLRQSIDRLTAPDESLGRGPFGGFVTWFRPKMSPDEANAAVKAAPVGTWLIRLSGIQNEFTLHWQATDCFPPLVCRLRYDGLAADGRVYSAVPDNEGRQFAASWKGLIVARLGLRMEDAFSSPH
jgi:hypothetical protein